MRFPKLILPALTGALTLSGCLYWDADAKRPRSPITAQAKTQCDAGETRVYRPIDRKNPKSYEAAIPPSYDAPSQLPSECDVIKKKLG